MLGVSSTWRRPLGSLRACWRFRSSPRSSRTNGARLGAGPIWGVWALAGDPPWPRLASRTMNQGSSLSVQPTVVTVQDDPLALQPIRHKRGLNLSGISRRRRRTSR